MHNVHCACSGNEIRALKKSVHLCSFSDDESRSGTYVVVVAVARTGKSRTRFCACVLGRRRWMSVCCVCSGCRFWFDEAVWGRGDFDRVCFTTHWTRSVRFIVCKVPAGVEADRAPCASTLFFSHSLQTASRD